MAFEYTPVDGYVFISPEEAKKQLRLDAGFTEEDDLLGQYIDAAQSAAEQYTERSIINETLTVTLDAFESVVNFTDWRPVKKSDVVVSVIPEGETEYVTVDADDYSFLKYCGAYQIRFKEDIAVADVEAAVKIVVDCKVPPVVKQAGLLKMADFYAIRENRGAMDREVFEKLLFPFRKF